ncbi:UbiD family decarboxylase [Tetragenococcus koreensis]|uniref:3-octaprenyl-4-hydroxybenzoate carboxy-lyase n=1 Tax=Tetragenococcus koreensis TaxID=290335 RepID=A0AAN4UDH5_9ENTE|nr:UbiD family decarboxylase [Tetragenococcus koreensis]GEQ50336.1 3-octaprenyl-4-hydroxybenzoate carboxy-lyase [Tetragenococcus koreensis]GEQ52826.1 3-octaprenyl-4-hydroxybenzoate carboxy-lyase [Tetragenococcus koreensis]GEQ55316.1 3-octaprenyl-4-hydroxybenzoate carboxy-lyase [Tetragenococcus koreensis]GEQ57793.1 3-octaprenyl-4-hydroxybenzoate carboxy-lyase [Tetragenococcus koreensis]GEQ60322.1 3-octaprenyl-4-hydroxybenzoate carboxy-lyase [Tetragenococcus koreensis]
MSEQPYDLRKVLEELKQFPNQYHETDKPIDPNADLSGVYRYIGAGGTVMRPTQEGPALTFNTIEGFPNTRVSIGTMASRKRVGEILHHDYKTLGKLLYQSVEHPVKPIKVDKEQAPAQEVVHLANDDDFDIRKILPAPTNTPEDAGPYITMGVVLGSDPDKTMTDVTIHRMVLEDKDTIGMYIMPGGRHIGHFQKQFEAENKPMPITINIGLDPAIAIGTTFEPPTTPLGYNELWIAGALRDEPVQLVDATSVNEVGIARSEFTIEAEILPNQTMQEDINTNTGKAMPEFPGYNGDANPAVNVVKVKAVTHRKDRPIMQTTIGPSEEHVSMAGIPTEASILGLVEKAIPGKVLNVYNPPAGGGKLMTIMQINKENEADEGIQRQAAILALSSFKELKTVILVDEDVDIFDMNDVMWTLNTRFQGDKDVVVIPGMRNHPLDPSERPQYNPGTIRFKGMSAKTILDGTVPFDMKDQFQRAQFKEIPNWEDYLNDSN